MMTSPLRALAAAMPLTTLLPLAAGQVVSPYTHQDAPVIVCFARNTDPAYVARIQAIIDLQNAVFGDATRYHLGNRWPGTAGVPINLTWSFVPDGVQVPGSSEPASANELFAKFDTAFAGQGGRAAWVAKFQQVFNRWAELTGVRYTRVTFGGQDWDDGAAFGSAAQAGRRGDCRITMHPIDGAFGILAYDFFPTSGDMVMDSNDITYFADSTASFQNFMNTVAHEHGHGLGLEHTCSNNSHVLMEPLQEGGFFGPQQDDIRAVHSLYGDHYESNDTPATATPIGALTPGAIVNFGTITAAGGLTPPGASVLSIEGAGKLDWYSFTVATAAPAAVSVTPVGTTYDDSAQTGGCPGVATNINALTIADLALQVYGGAGASLLGSANTGGLGVAESVTTSTLQPGTYQVKVYSATSAAQAQLYKLSLACPTPAVTTAPAPKTVNAGQTTTLTAAANNAVTYKWRKAGIAVNDGGNISGSNTPTLTFSPARMADSGAYSVAITNACGQTVTASAALTVNCLTNCDGSTTAPILNIADFTCFVTRFNAGDPWANCDGSTVAPTLNILDFVCYQQRMAAGCP
jgi:hypothetical protein